MGWHSGSNWERLNWLKRVWQIWKRSSQLRKQNLAALGTSKVLSGSTGVEQPTKATCNTWLTMAMKPQRALASLLGRGRRRWLDGWKDPLQANFEIADAISYRRNAGRLEQLILAPSCQSSSVRIFQRLTGICLGYLQTKTLFMVSHLVQ